MHPPAIGRWLLFSALAIGLMAPPLALARAQDDYGGTYGGLSTTGTGYTVPLVLYVEDAGDVMRLRVVVKGYTVPVSAKESWSSNDSVTISPSVNVRIAKGSGTATFSRAGDRWLVSGSGSGGVYNILKLEWVNGSAQGSAERLSPAVDTALGNKWIADHPEKRPTKTRQVTAVAAASERAARPLAPAQLPLSDTDRYELLFILLFLTAMSFFLSKILGKPWGALSESPSKSLQEVLPRRGGAR